MKYTIRKYEQEDYSVWNDFVAQAKNATFLFHRDFMEYHQDRFQDFSLLIFEEEKLKAILPANKKENAVYSHQGLTYGGLVFLRKLNGEKAELILDSVLGFLKENNIEAFYYKPIPNFYFSEGNQEIDFFLLKRGAVIERKEMNLAVNLNLPLKISKSKLKHFRRIENLDLDIIELPKLNEVKFVGVKKGKVEGLIKDNNLTKNKIVNENLITTTKNYIENKYKKDGFFNTKVNINTVIDTAEINMVNMVVKIDKGAKIKINEIDFRQPCTEISRRFTLNWS